MVITTRLYGRVAHPPRANIVPRSTFAKRGWGALPAPKLGRVGLFFGPSSSEPAIHGQHARVTGGIEAEAGQLPLTGRQSRGPVAGMVYQTALHGIQVHVFQFLPDLFLGEGVEVVEAALPETRLRETRWHLQSGQQLVIG